jgi:hypothetical protein
MRVLVSAQHTSRDDGDFRILLEKDSFTLDFTDWSITPSFARTHVLKYAVGHDTARRIEPVAPNPEGFVEEWMASPWSVARDWSDSAQRSSLAVWHKKLNEADRKPPMLGNEAFLQACSAEQRVIQITFPVQFPTTGPKSGDVFFLVRETGPHLYRLVDIRRESALGCTAPEPDESQGEHLLPESLSHHGTNVVR